MIKLIILDVDGILTDGTKCYNSDGEVISKSFCDKDWTAIKRFKAIGVNVVFITGDGFNATILRNRNLSVTVCRSGGIHVDKSEYLDGLCKEYQCVPEEVCFVGDDIFDIGIMRKVKFPYCVYKSPNIVMDYSSRLPSHGGDNAIMALFDELEYKKLIPKVSYDDIIEKIYDLDVKEKF